MRLPVASPITASSYDLLEIPSVTSLTDEAAVTAASQYSGLSRHVCHQLIRWQPRLIGQRPDRCGNRSLWAWLERLPLAGYDQGYATLLRCGYSGDADKSKATGTLSADAVNAHIDAILIKRPRRARPSSHSYAMLSPPGAK